MQMRGIPGHRGWTVEDVVDGGDKVVARVRFTGTHGGEFMGMPPTGRSVDVGLIDIMRFGDDGLVHEHWGVFDAMAMMQQLGAVRKACALPGTTRPEASSRRPGPRA